MNGNPQSNKLENGELSPDNSNNCSKYFEEREIAAEELKQARLEFRQSNENLLLEIRELSRSLEMSIEQSSYCNLAPKMVDEEFNRFGAKIESIQSQFNLATAGLACAKNKFSEINDKCKIIKEGFQDSFSTLR